VLLVFVQLVMEWISCKKHALGLLVVPGLCISIIIIHILGKNTRVNPLCVLGVGY